MKEQDFRALVANPDLISGIYNYCDRWCERCPFTSRCLTYLTLLEDDTADPAGNDLQNEKFWEKLHDSFQLTTSLLKGIAEKQGIDISSTAEEIEIFAKQRETEIEDLWQSDLSQLAMAYLKTGKSWLDGSSKLIRRMEDEISRNLQLGLPDAHPQSDANAIKETIDVAVYYIHQIYVKLVRAQDGKKMPLWDGAEDFPKDYDGSAKVALIGIDRSIGAWGILFQHFPDEEATILPLLSILERLRKMVESEFPEARAFVRAGFDEDQDSGR